MKCLYFQTRKCFTVILFALDILPRWTLESLVEMFDKGIKGIMPSRSLKSLNISLCIILITVSVFMVGIYVCSKCGNKLFHSKTKFSHNSPWPAFTDTVNEDSVLKEVETEPQSSSDATALKVIKYSTIQTS